MQDSSVFQRSLRINDMDLDVDPCDDFHKFVCGNACATSYGSYSNIEIPTDAIINKQVWDLLFVQYIQQHRHIVLKIAMNLFEKCMIATPIEDYMKSVLNVVSNAVGEWPLLQDSWDETKFDWLQATYRLRELGLPHSIFFNLSVAVDPRSEDDRVFKISLPIAEFRQEVVRKVVELLGANRENIYSEIEDIQKFVSTLNNGDSHGEELGAIDDYQYDDQVDWPQFINKIVGPTIQMPEQHVAIFPQPRRLINRLHVLATTPKRIQANYMIWKIVEEMVDIKEPHFLLKLRSEYSYFYRKTSPEEDCLNLISRRFAANPIAILYAREYVPLLKSKLANELTTNIKEELLKLINRADWMDKIDQENTIERVNTMVIKIGAPENYYNDKILDEMNADLEETTDDDLLSLILQVNKNYQTHNYKQINSSVRKSDFAIVNQPVFGPPEYSYTNNMMSLPLGFLQGFVFGDSRPNYLNYGGLGAIMGFKFSSLFGKSTTGFPNTNDENLWTNKTKDAFAKQRNCLTTQAKKRIKFEDIGYLDYEILTRSLGVKLSYSAYEQWSMENDPEPLLIGLDYTPNQLFWISTGHVWCEKFQERYGKIDPTGKSKALSHLVSSLAMNNWNFAKDFNCSFGSNMNPAKKCDIF